MEKGGRRGVLDISLLGEQMIKDEAGTVRTRSSRTLALVAFLVVHSGSPQTRQRIAASFWPDSSDEQALTNLRRELHNLRSTLGNERSLVVQARELTWNDTASCRVDVRTFRIHHASALAAATAGNIEGALAHADAAVGDYRGELMPGSYDDWLLEARSDLEQQCVELLDLIGQIRTEQGDLVAAADSARRRIQYRPLEEIGYRRLIELQGELGDRAGAVSTYHHCASVLERELGIEPDPSTRRALDHLLARTGPGSGSLPGGDSSATRPRAGAARLVGRSRELDALEQVWSAAVAGRPGIALVHGDPGVGKTRLVSELAQLAQSSGAVVATAQCFGSAGQLALSPVADWLRTPRVAAELRGLDPLWQAAVDRLVPSGTEQPQGHARPTAMVDAWQRHRFFDGLAHALLSVRRPMLLVLDNVQWCDQETLAFLTFYLGLSGAAEVMVAGTVRKQDRPHGLTEWMTRMRATGLVTDVTLDPLDVTGTVSLAEVMFGRQLTTEHAEVLQAATGGFPLYIVEAARSGNAGADPSSAGDLRAVLRTRLDQVAPTTREVAGLAAAVGRNFTLDLLTEASDLDADTVVHAVDELWRHRIVREIADGYDFSHDLLRDTAYADVSPPKRWLLHRRIAQGLELLHAHEPDVISAQLAEQYARSGRGDRAVIYYKRAAEVAARRYAHVEAIRLHKAALTIVRAQPAGHERDAQELVLLEGVAAPLNARFGYASAELLETLERSVVLAENLGRRTALVTALVGRWSSQFVRGRSLEAHRTATRALELAEPGSELSDTASFAVGGSLVVLARPAEALRHFEMAAARGGTPALPIGARPDVHGRAFAAHAHWLLGHDADAARTVDESLALARTDDSPYNVAIALAYGAVTHQLARDTQATTKLVTELCDLCERYDFAYYREWALILDGWCSADGSGLDQARRGVDNLVAQNSFARLPYWLSIVADLASRAGQPEVARARLDAAIATAITRNDIWWLPEVMRMRAAFDDAETAVGRLQAAARMAAAHGSVALFERCVDDLAALGAGAPVALRPAAFAPLSD